MVDISERVRHVLRLSFLRKLIGDILLQSEWIAYTNHSSRSRLWSWSCVGVCILGHLVCMPLITLLWLNELCHSKYHRYINKPYNVAPLLTAGNRSQRYQQNEEKSSLISQNGQFSNDCPENVRVLSFNIQSCRGMDGIVNIHRIAEVINESRATVVCLQEIEDNTSTSGPLNQIKTLAKLCGFEYHHFLVTRLQNGGKYGDAILSRLPFTEEFTHYFPKWQWRNRRGMIGVLVKDVWIVTTHLQNDFLFEEQYSQVRDLLSYCEDKLGDKVILTGDLNAPSWTCAALELQSKFVELVDDSTFPSLPLPFCQLDHILCSKAMVPYVEGEKAKNMLGHRDGVFKNSKMTASDHLPICVDFVF